MANPDGYIFGPRAIEELRDGLRKVKRIKPPPPTTIDRGPAHFPYQAPGERFKNGAGEPIPAYAVMAIDNATKTGDAPDYLNAVKPSETFRRTYAINGSQEVGTKDTARCSFGVAQALYDSADGTPANGETWGPKPGSWKLAKGYSGFVVLGVVGELAVVVPQVNPVLIGKTTALVSPGNTTDWAIYAGALGSETITTFVAPTANTRIELADDIWIKATPAGAGYILEPLQCEPDEA